jgi:hypothetical protein
MAKLHILYPTMVTLHEDSFKQMSAKEIRDIVNSAMQGLSQVKEEKQKEIISNLWQMLETDQVDISVIDDFKTMLERNGATLPEEIHSYREESLKFSEDLASKLSSKINIEELESEIESSKCLKITTEVIEKLKSTYEKAKAWSLSAESIIDAPVQFSELSRLLVEGSKIKAELPLFESIKSRYELAETLLKQSESSATTVESRKTRSNQKRKVKKKISREEAEGVLERLEEIKVEDGRVEELKRELEKIRRWEKEVEKVKRKEIDEGEVEI